MDGFRLHLIATNAASWQRKMLNGRPHWVGPATMIVPGVLNGSKGALAYTPEDIKEAVHAWNGMPITLGHPQDEAGNYTSARHPSILDKFQLGQVLNARYTNKLVAEAWIDEELAANRAPEVLNKIKAGEPIGLSTGLGTKDEDAPIGSVWNYKNGQRRPYKAFARNHQPDHLAVLLNQKGACSIDDGCALGVNAESVTEDPEITCERCGGNAKEGSCRCPDEELEKSKTFNLLERMWNKAINAFLPNQPRSQVTGKIKKQNAGQGKGAAHEAVQDGYFGAVGGHTKPGEEPDDDEDDTKNAQDEIVTNVDVDSFLVANYIREEDGKFNVYSEAGKKLGEYDSRGEAEKRLKQIEYFKHTKNEDEITLQDIVNAFNPDQARDPDGKFASGGGGGAGPHTNPYDQGKEGQPAGYKPPNEPHTNPYDAGEGHQPSAGYKPRGGAEPPSGGEKRVVLEEQLKTAQAGFKTARKAGDIEKAQKLQDEIGKLQNRLKVYTTKPRTPTGNQGQGDDDMKTRKEKIAFLVANCDCWKEKGELLGNEKLVDDKTLDGLVANVQQAQAGKLAVNALKEIGTEFKLDDGLAVNEMPAALKKAMKAKEDATDSGADDAEEDDTGKKVTKNKSKDGNKKGEESNLNLNALTDEQKDLLSKALFGHPVKTVTAGLNLAVNYEQKEKEIVINKLTGHITDPAKKAERVKKLAVLGLNELYDRLADMPDIVSNGAGGRRDRDDEPRGGSFLGRLLTNVDQPQGESFTYNEQWQKFDDAPMDWGGKGTKKETSAA